jgi:hypothetical protein
MPSEPGCRVELHRIPLLALVIAVLNVSLSAGQEAASPVTVCQQDAAVCVSQTSREIGKGWQLLRYNSPPLRNPKFLYTC